MPYRDPPSKTATKRDVFWFNDTFAANFGAVSLVDIDDELYVFFVGDPEPLKPGEAERFLRAYRMWSEGS
jgi:hypothetical protein